MKTINALWTAFRTIAVALAVVSVSIAVLGAVFSFVGIHPNMATALPVMLLSGWAWWRVLASVWQTAYGLAGGTGKA